MKAVVEELIAVLDGETRLACNLLEQLQTDHKLIIHQEIVALEASNLVKEELIIRFQSLEEQRMRLTLQLGNALGIPAEELRISKICPQLGADGTALESSAEKLRAVIGSLSELVAISRGFLEQSILGIRGLLSLIQSLRTPDAQTYGADGQVEAASSNDAVSIQREA